MGGDNLLFAFSLTLLAGLSTGIGSLLSLLTKKTSKVFLSVALGFSAGVMIYISFAEIYVESKRLLMLSLGEKMGSWVNICGFFFGILLIGLIDKMIPFKENPHEIHTIEEMDGTSESHKANLMRVGVLSALAICIHNFPEGIATFTTALNYPNLGIPIAFAIALHNIPEGIAVAVPVFYATGSRKRAFWISFLSGLSEPLGAVIGYVFLNRFINDATFGFVFASIAGIMVYISLDELLPSAREFGEHHLAIYGLVLGMAVMAISLQFLN